MEKQELDQLTGEVVDIVFSNEETGFCVFNIDAGGELVCVVGEMSGIGEGEEVVVHGRFTFHPTYGRQFKAAAYERKLPGTAAAIRKYLSSGVVRGVGPVLAKKMVEAFGENTLSVIENEPQRLAEVKGITAAKAEKIAEEYRRVNGIRSVMLYLSRYGIEASAAIRIWKKWGASAQDAVENDPYVLCTEEFGLSFEIADNIARELDFDAMDVRRMNAAVLHVLRRNLLSGHTCLPRDKLCAKVCELLDLGEEDVQPAITQAIEEKLIVSTYLGGEREFLYQPHLYQAERYIAGRLLLMAQIPGEEKATDEEIRALEGREGICFAQLQREGIRSALSHQISILTGGPGTGKTTTLNAIISLFEARGHKVALAAPTGRAAKRMSDMTHREAKTIHRLLEVDTTDEERRRFKHHEQNTLTCDVLILDEVSMVDVPLMESLLRAMRLRCRLVLVGDADQLPSVSAGNVLRDLIRSGEVHTTRLTEIFRQAQKSRIVLSAHDIVAGRVPKLDVREQDGDFFFLPRAGDAQSLETVGELYVSRLPRAYGLSPLWDIQVIAPTRVGALGTAAINTRLQQLVNPASPDRAQVTFMGVTLREGDKVMQIKNNYDIEFERDDGSRSTGVFNGDIGAIEAIDRASRTLFIRYEDRVAEYDFDMLDQIELAYAVTVHKSQGSEFEAVIIPLMSYPSRMYFRNLFYTAVTRARRLLILVGSSGAVRYMVQNDRRTIRYTGLCQFLKEGDGLLD